MRRINNMFWELVHRGCVFHISEVTPRVFSSILPTITLSFARNATRRHDDCAGV